MPQPDFEPVPEALRGQPSFVAMITWMGDDHAEGERVTAPFREKVPPTMDFVRPAPYAFLQRATDPMTPHGRKSYMDAYRQSRVLDLVVLVTGCMPP